MLIPLNNQVTKTSHNNFNLVIKIFGIAIISIASLVLVAPLSLKIQAQNNIKVENILSLNFNQPIAVSKINPVFNNQKDDFVILNASSKLDFEGKTQSFNLSNEKQLNYKEFIKNYKKSKSAFLNTLSTLKDKTEKKETIENKDAVASILNKYSKTTIEKTKQKNAKNELSFTSIILGGSLKTLNNIKNSELGKLSTNSEIINLDQIQKQMDEFKLKLENAKTEEQKQQILDSISPKTNSKLELTEIQIQEVDKFVKKDIAGNSFVSSQDLKKLNLKPAQVSQITTAISEYNKLPEEIKDGSQDATQNILQTAEFETQKNKEDGIVEKIGQAIIGAVKAEAGCWRGFYDWGTNWWGKRIRVNSC